MGKCEDLTGRVFNKLTVLQYAGRDNSRKPTWYCKCSCGNKNIIGPLIGAHLKNGSIKSCGCYSKEISSKIASNPNKVEKINEKVIKIYTSQGFFICDYKDWKKYSCEKITWRLGKDSTYNNEGFYVKGQIKGIGLNKKDRKVIYFHRYIMEAMKNEEVDHLNGCGLDNRRKNLRKCKRVDNSKNLKLNRRNTSGHRGVSYNKRNNKWRARIVKNKKEYFLGEFEKIEDAIKAREEAEEKMFKDYSAKNSRGIIYENIPITINKIIQNILNEE